MLSPAIIRRYYAQADEALNTWVEYEMFRLMRKHPTMSVLLKCMGQLTAYSSKDGHSFEPAYLRPLQKLLDECDRSYNCRTGRPLKISRGFPDRTALIHTREW